jgi:hypothetical protein
MKQMTFGKIVSVVTCALLLCASVPTQSIADQAQYIYDDLGRLSQESRGREMSRRIRMTPVGNLLSITRNTGGVGATTITAFTPNTGIAGTSV